MGRGAGVIDCLVSRVHGGGGGVCGTVWRCKVGSSPEATRMLWMWSYVAFSSLNESQ